MNADPHITAAPLDHATIRSIVIGIMLAMFLAALDQTIVATAMPTIGRELKDLEHLPWIASAYLLSATAVTPLYGKLSDIHGRRRVLLLGIVIFIIGSVACALAPSMLVLILARSLQGLGGGGLISLAQTIIADVVAPMERARYQGWIASVFVTSSVAGPVLGGFFAEHLHWSMIFWITAPASKLSDRPSCFCIALPGRTAQEVTQFRRRSSNLPLGLLAFWMTGSALRHLPRHERPHRLDLIGALLIVLASVTFMLALTWGGISYPWSSAPIVLLFVSATLASILFAARLLTAAEPLLPLAILLNPVVSCGTAAACFAMGTFIGLSIYLPVYLELVLGLTASGTGLALIPFMGGVVTGATLSGRLMMHLRHYKRPPVIGLAVATAGILLLAWRATGLPLLAVEVIFAIVGVGIGTVLPVTTVAIQNAVNLYQLGTATGTMNFFRSLGGAVAVAIFGAIVLGGIVAPGADPEKLAEVAAHGGIDIARIFHHLFLAAAGGLALGLAWLLAMAERPLRSGRTHARDGAAVE